MTPTSLAETIAELQRYIDTIGEQAACGALSVRKGELTLLLRCARRCEAMERVDVSSWTDLFETTGLYELTTQQNQLLKDLASERDALAKRVEELEEYADSQRSTLVQMTAESTRLRAENERLKSCGAREVELKAEVARLKHRLSVRTDLEAEKSLELIAAQDRVRELEATLAIVRHNEARLIEVSMYRSRLLAEHGIKEPLYPVTGNQSGPITDPTQGVVTLKGNNE